MGMRGREGFLFRMVVVLAIGVLSTVGMRSCFRRPLRVGTFNIRAFGREAKDIDRLVAVVEEARSDVLALQEMQNPDSVRDLAARLSHDGRRFRFVLVDCASKSNMKVGFLFDESRVALTRTKEYPELDPKGGQRCGDERSALAARFEPVGGGRAFQLLVVHLVPGGEPKQQEKRRQQWRDAHVIAADLAKETSVAIIGDVNSTGFLDDAGGERTFILDEAKRAGLGVVTQDLKCTEYFQPKKQKQFAPSVLDHVVASPDFSSSRPAEVHGYCARLACAPSDTKPDDFENVSDHCPVTIDMR